jgi:hypothetical protein
VVIVGANGSGKTRLGTWLEFEGGQQGQIHRVAAQRSLTFPEGISTTTIANAEFSFQTGFQSYDITDRQINEQRAELARQGKSAYTKIYKYQHQEPEVAQVNDFRGLLTYLFSEQNEVNLAYADRGRQGILLPPPETKLERIKQIWQSVLTHRQLIISVSGISVQSVGPLHSGGAYKASAMSDGERVAFYLIGQCLLAKPNSIIAADEPEIHLHRSIQLRLWNAIEKARPDCLFVYLTHDLDFAASRTNAKKLWIKSYNGLAWTWQEVLPTEGIPEDLLLTVLGSRAPVLFTEGTPGKFEQAVYSRVYPNCTVTPCGGCEQVIEATKAFTRLKHLHGIECRGLIDRDYRTQEDVDRLEAQGIFTLTTQEFENIMLAEGVLSTALTHAQNSGSLIGSSTIPERLTAIKAYLFAQLANDKLMLTSKRASWEIEKDLRKFGTAGNAQGLEALQAAVTAIGACNVTDLYHSIDQEFTRIIQQQDYNALINLYNNKGLGLRIGHFFSLRDNYPAYLERLLALPDNTALVQAFHACCPPMPPVMTTVITS